MADSMATDERRIEYIPLAELLTRLHPRNPKQHDIGAIVQSYQHHGYVANGVLDSRTGLFLAGHGRIKALARMKQQGMEAPHGIRNGGADWLVPVQVGYESESDEAALAYLAADNKLTELGGWDEPALAELLQEIHDSGEVALEASGFDADDLDTLLNDLGMRGEPTPDPGAQVDRAAEVQEKWQVQRGDVWQVGAHRVMCGDSTCKEDVARLMGGVSVELVVADPPYGVGYDYVSHNDNDIDGYNRLMTGFFDVLPNAPRLITVGHKNNNFWFENMNPDSFLIWFDPTKQSPHKCAYLCKSELILVFGKLPHRYSWDTFQVNGIRGDGLRELHTCPKPVELFNKLIEPQTTVGGIVFDPFLGSGTTLVACEQTNRIGYGMEISEAYVAVTLQRLSDMGLQPKRADDE
jgi:hypothetical protein